MQIEKTSLVTLKGMEVLNLNITKAFFDTMDSTIETWKEDMRNATVKDMEVVRPFFLTVIPFGLLAPSGHSRLRRPRRSARGSRHCSYQTCQSSLSVGGSLQYVTQFEGESPSFD